MATFWIRAEPVARVAFPIWGGGAELLVTDPGAVDDGERLLRAELEAVGAACSRFQAGSELSRVNTAQGRAVAVSALFREFLDVALRAASLTAGAVDPTVGSALVVLGYDRDFAELRARDAAAGPGRHRAPGNAAREPRPSQPLRPAPELQPSGVTAMALRPVPGWQVIEVDPHRGTVRVPEGVRLDLGATAKAHAADRAASRLAATLGCGVLVNLSGDVALAGPAPVGGWPILAADGEDTGPDAPGQTIALHDGGAATSGTTVRVWRQGVREVHHIVDPDTGDAADPPWATVSAVAGSCADANILTTAALVRGERLLPWLRASGCPMRLLAADGRITLLSGWPEEKS